MVRKVAGISIQDFVFEGWQQVSIGMRTGDDDRAQGSFTIILDAVTARAVAAALVEASHGDEVEKKHEQEEAVGARTGDRVLEDCADRTGAGSGGTHPDGTADEAACAFGGA